MPEWLHDGMCERVHLRTGSRKIREFVDCDPYRGGDDRPRDLGDALGASQGARRQLLPRRRPRRRRLRGTRDRICRAPRVRGVPRVHELRRGERRVRSRRRGSWRNRSRPHSSSRRPCRGELTTELVCYARSVVGVQWDRMEAGTLGEDLNPWARQVVPTRSKRADPQTPTEQAAYSKWLDERSAAKKRAATGSTARSA